MSDRKRIVVLLGAAACWGLVSAQGTAVAGEVSSCVDFCSPVDAHQLDHYRAQGLDAPAAGGTKLGVILWDEYRRMRQPGDTSGVVGNAPAILNASVTGTTTIVH